MCVGMCVYIYINISLYISQKTGSVMMVSTKVLESLRPGMTKVLWNNSWTMFWFWQR